MPEPILAKLIAVLAGWSLLSSSAAFIGVHRTARPFWRAFWHMTALWAAVAGLSGITYLLSAPVTSLGPKLRYNAGLDGLLMACGAILCTRPSPKVSGYGLAIVVQGAFLLLHSLFFWQRCS